MDDAERVADEEVVAVPVTELECVREVDAVNVADADGVLDQLSDMLAVQLFEDDADKELLILAEAE